MLFLLMVSPLEFVFLAEERVGGGGEGKTEEEVEEEEGRERERRRGKTERERRRGTTEREREGGGRERERERETEREREVGCGVVGGSVMSKTSQLMLSTNVVYSQVCEHSRQSRLPACLQQTLTKPGSNGNHTNISLCG